MNSLKNTDCRQTTAYNFLLYYISLILHAFAAVLRTNKLVNIIYTVCNRKEIAGALLLGAQVKNLMPATKFIIGWVDEGIVPDLPDYIEIISILDTKPDAWNERCARYYEFELVAACRPTFALHILTRYTNTQHLSFLSPNTTLYQPFDHFLTRSEHLLLSPHTVNPLKNESGPDDKKILNIGIFHSGGWIMRRSDETLSFLEWWANRTIDRAHFDLCNGMCMDQLWLNYAPVLLPSFYAIPETSWRLGLHNAAAVRFGKDGDILLVDGKPLISADFSGLSSFHPVWSDFRESIYRYPVFIALYRNYLASLKPLRVQKHNGPAAFGKPTPLKPFRNQRKQMSAGLKSLNHYIETFSI